VDDIIIPAIAGLFILIGFGVCRVAGWSTPQSPVTGVVILVTMIVSMIVGLFVLPTFDFVLIVSGACAGVSVVALAFLNHEKSHRA
jgi:hypothetical protein